MCSSSLIIVDIQIKVKRTTFHQPDKDSKNSTMLFLIRTCKNRFSFMNTLNKYLLDSTLKH